MSQTARNLIRLHRMRLLATGCPPGANLRTTQNDERTSLSPAAPAAVAALVFHCVALRVVVAAVLAARAGVRLRLLCALSYPLARQLQRLSRLWQQRREVEE